MAPRGAAARAAAGPALVPGATTYTATLAPAEAFGRQLQAAAQRRGLGWARRVAVLGDGAKWIWKLAARRFPGAVQVVDWYHARAHLWALAQLLYGEGTAAAWAWLETVAGELWLAAAPADVDVVALAAAEAWAAPRRRRARPAAPRRAGGRWPRPSPTSPPTPPGCATPPSARRACPSASGVVEGGCHSVLHVRLKRPGARWAVESAERMVRARAVLCSDPDPRLLAPRRPPDRLTPGTIAHTPRAWGPGVPGAPAWPTSAGATSTLPAQAHRPVAPHSNVIMPPLPVWPAAQGRGAAWAGRFGRSAASLGGDPAEAGSGSGAARPGSSGGR